MVLAKPASEQFSTHVDSQFRHEALTLKLYSVWESSLWLLEAETGTLRRATEMCLKQGPKAQLSVAVSSHPASPLSPGRVSLLCLGCHKKILGA